MEFGSTLVAAQLSQEQNMIVERTAAITVRVQVEVQDDDDDEIEETVAEAAIGAFESEYGLTVRAKDIIVLEE